MSTMTRKQREIQEREETILMVARNMLITRGYLGLTMGRIAREMEYSKGTIYQHFGNKEEIIAALLIETAQKRASFFERAALFPGRPRERMAAVGEAEALFVELNPRHFQVEKLIDADSIREKTSDARQAERLTCDHACANVVGGILRDGVAQGDLSFGERDSLEGLQYGLMTMAFGSHLVEVAKKSALEHKGIKDRPALLRRNYALFLDAYGFRPLSSEWDYEMTYERIRDEIFPEETAKALVLGAKG